MPYHLPGEIPEVSTLPLPSGAGATLPVSTADRTRLPGVDPATQLPIRPGSEAPAGPGFFARLGEQLQDPKTLRGIAVGLMALGDATERLTLRGLQKPRDKTTLQQFLELEAAQASEARKGTTEQERLELERQRVAIARTGEQRQIVEARGNFIQTVIKNAPLVLAMDAEARAPVIQAYREQATALGLDSSQISDLFTKRKTMETVSQYAPYLEHYGPGIWEQASIVKATKGEVEYFKFIEERAAGAIRVAATNRVRDVVNNLEQAKGAGKVTFDHVSTAMQAAAPLEWQAIIANREEYEPYLLSRGIKTPGLAAKGAELTAAEEAKQRAAGVLPIIEKDVAAALTSAGFDPRKMRAENPIHQAALQAAEKTAKAGRIDVAGDLERAKQTVKAEFGEGKSLAERIEELRGSGNTAKADRLLALQREMKDNIQINLPKTPPTEIIKDVQSTKLAARRLSRVVEKFDPAFVGMLGKAKGISTRFSDLPGIPAFAERKAFANDLIAMTNDVKKNLLGAARSAPELADVARFLPDPDQNLSVAEFVGNLEAFVGSYLDVVDVLPSTMKELDLKTVDLTEERAMLVKALGTLRAARTGLGLPPGLQIRGIRRIE